SSAVTEAMRPSCTTTVWPSSTRSLSIGTTFTPTKAIASGSGATGAGAAADAESLRPQAASTTAAARTKGSRCRAARGGAGLCMAVSWWAGTKAQRSPDPNQRPRAPSIDAGRRLRGRRLRQVVRAGFGKEPVDRVDQRWKLLLRVAGAGQGEIPELVDHEQPRHRAHPVGVGDRAVSVMGPGDR